MTEINSAVVEQECMSILYQKNYCLVYIFQEHNQPSVLTLLLGHRENEIYNREKEGTYLKLVVTILSLQFIFKNLVTRFPRNVLK
jgi:hypothetical protein